MKALLACILPAGLLAAGALVPIAGAQTPPPPSQAAPSQAGKRTAPLPGGEAALRTWIDRIIQGAPDYAAMTPVFAGAIRNDLRAPRELFTSFGALKSLAFKEVGPQGADVYTATFDNRTFDFRVTLDGAGR